ncbi:DUF1307 domain-containing protein [Aliicoccus persicus]|uniref:Lipoprotein n=1 Tax=Aliicoccus persicus TaxID=930138 RepID=A0A662Z568_9STAP|nr:DUF1307 domain-containing protein [Aliicoccus persicus]SEW16992.1 Protein of unknown function [Aliicoccus persicus]
MRKLLMLMLVSVFFIVGCNNDSNDRDPITLDTDEAASDTEETKVSEDAEDTEPVEDIPEEYQGLGLEKFERVESGVTSNVTLEFEDNVVLQQTTENSANFEDVGLTLESATEEEANLTADYSSIYDVTYETELIYVGGTEKMIIDYRNQRDEIETLNSLFMNEIPILTRDTTVEDAIEFFIDEGYTHIQD